MSEPLMQLIQGMFEYYNQPASKIQVKIYLNALSKYEIEQIAKAFNNHIHDPDAGQFMPKVADFVRALHGTKKSQTAAAWSSVDKALREQGPYSTVTFDDAITMQTIQDMGGWISLCDCKTEKDLDFKMHEFNRIYEGYLTRGGVSEHPRKLVGLTEAENKRYSIEHQPVLLGNTSAALDVYEKGGDQKTLDAVTLDRVKLSFNSVKNKQLN